ncbi:MAG: DNA repair exonuclease [Candidatus Aenigmarchaeota archaeon]|nr:DNA repair exonuclease [Candidatus Aenigmarchaeota archaeon]
MKFAHMADVHLGSWNAHPDLRELPVAAFRKAIDICMHENVDFILVAGDLFDTSLPSMDILKDAVAVLKRCADAGIRVYVVPGSHDFSPSGKTMIAVLDEAGLVKDVSVRWAHDKTGAKIFGMPGKKLGLEATIFDDLDLGLLEKEGGFKIFLFHSAVSDLAAFPASISLSSLPKNFDYYATGHMHETYNSVVDCYGRLAFPGALFPTSFDELEKNRGSNGFFILDVREKIHVDWREVRICDVALVDIDASGRKPKEIEGALLERIKKYDIREKILLLKLHGRLDGKQSEIDMKNVMRLAGENGARSVKKSVHFEMTEEKRPLEKKTDMEDEIIEYYLDSSKLRLEKGEQKSMMISLMEVLGEEKNEDETHYDFEERIRAGARKVLGI